MYRNILDLLEKQAIQNANKLAFGDETKDITFGELVDKSRVVGAHLVEKIQIAEPVAFYMDKSVDAVCGMFGTVYAGGFYSFLDVKQPLSRIKTVLDVLKPSVIFTTASLLDKANELVSFADFEFAIEVIVLEDVLNRSEISKGDESRLQGVRTSFCDINPLYVNFTSGSTGIPKGVAVSHRSVIEFIECFVDIFGIEKDDIIANQAPFDFDVSVKDIYSGLMTGAKVQLIPKAYFSKPTDLMDYLCEKNVTVLIWAVSAMCFVSIMKGFEYKLPKHIRLVMFSGEVLPIKHYKKWKQFLPNATFVNLYGPTEITCNCTYYVLDKEFDDTEVIPIGKAFPNERVFLLDENDKLVEKEGELGELCVSGTSVALGYYKDTTRSAQAFVQNPLNDKYQEIIYRTGDLAFYNAEGDLVYASRKDHQIKHLGHRIELSEIDVHVTACEGVTRACCQYDGEKQRLVLFYTGAVEKKEILKELRNTVPPFMIPNSVIQVEEMPMNKNGKIDRKVLMDEYYK